MIRYKDSRHKKDFKRENSYILHRSVQLDDDDSLSNQMAISRYSDPQKFEKMPSKNIYLELKSRNRTQQHKSQEMNNDSGSGKAHPDSYRVAAKERNNSFLSNQYMTRELAEIYFMYYELCSMNYHLVKNIDIISVVFALFRFFSYPFSCTH